MATRLRFRSGPNPQSIAFTHDHYDRPGCLLGNERWSQYAENVWTLDCGWVESMVDVVTPGYHKRVRAGEIIMNSMRKVRSEISMGAGGNSYISRYTSNTCNASSPFYQKWRHVCRQGNLARFASGFEHPVVNGEVIMPNTICSGTELNDLIHEASTAALNEVGRPSGFNAWEDIAELKQTATLLDSMFRDLDRAIARKRGPFSRLGSVAGIHLAVRFGLVPFVKDVDGVIRGMKKKVGKMRQSARGEASATKSSSYSRQSTLFGGGLTSLDYSLQETISVRALSIQDYVATLASNVGFDTKGLVTLPWELVKLSFVVDWFANVGDYLGSWVPTFNSTQQGSCVTIRRQLVTTCTLGNSTPDTYMVFESAPTGYCTHTMTSVTRVPGPLQRGLVIRSDFKLDELRRAADAAALVAQRLRHFGLK